MRRQIAPMAAMAAVVCLDAVGTVSISELLGGADPLSFGFAVTVGVTAAVVAYLAVRQPSLLRPKSLVGLARLHRGDSHVSRMLRRDLLLGSLARLDWPLFTAAVSLTAPAVASILFLGLWPMLFVLILQRVTRSASDTRYRQMRSSDYAVMTAGAVGLTLVVLSHEAETSLLVSGWRTLAGTGLALVAVSFGAMGAFHYSWGRRTAALLTDRDVAVQRGSSEATATNLTMLAFLAANLTVLPALWILGLLVDPFGSMRIKSAEMVAAFVIGAVVVAPEGILTRIANLRTHNLTVNAISYLSPVASIALFVIVGRAAGINGALLTVGASGIVAVNLVLNFDPESPLADSQSAAASVGAARHGFKALIFAVWGCGAVVYFRENLLGLVGVTRVEWGDGEYWGLVALCATVFILILSFRQQRLFERTLSEQETAISLFRRVESLHQRGILLNRSSVRDALDVAGSPGVPRSRQAYVSLREALHAATEGSWSEEISAAEVELDLLMRSKQEGREFTDLVALALFGSTTVALALLARPAVTGWPAVLADVFATAFAAGIVFLFVALTDRMRTRDVAVLTHVPTEGNGFTKTETQTRSARGGTSPTRPMYLIGGNDSSSNTERTMSLLISTALVAAYCVLFHDKWAPSL